jgi:hypothetical protein
MLNQQRNYLYLLLAGVCALALSSPVVVSAWQQKATRPAEVKPKQEADDEPVAVTKKTTVSDAPAPLRIPGPGEFGNFRYPVINSKGDIAFVGLYATPPGSPQSYGQAVFFRSAAGEWKITREGEKIINLPDEITGINNLSLNETGELTFVAPLAGKAPLPTVASSLDVNAHINRGQGLFVKTAEGVKMLMRLGDEVPKMPSFFSGIANSSSNSKGTTAFIGTYTDPDGKGLFLHEQGQLKLIVRSGQKVGIGEDVFSEHYYPSQINERGEIAWYSRVGMGGGIFVLRPKGIEVAAYSGQPAPIKEAKFSGWGQRAPSISHKGDVAFTAFFDGPNAGRGLFLKKENGPVELVYRDGERVAGTTYNFTDFMNPMINARGDLAFVGAFGGRTRGIFIKTAKGLETVALMDQKLPGGKPDEIFNNFVQLAFNDKGELIFYGQFKNAEVGIFLYDAKGLRALVRRGEPLPTAK